MKRRMLCMLSLCSVLAAVMNGCGLSARQREDVSRWEAEAAQFGHPEAKYEEYLDASTAAGLGFLPFGIGGFYVYRPGLAVSGILCWPLSITWLPAVAARSANQYNYNEFRKKMIVFREEQQARWPSTSAGTGAPRGSPSEDPAIALERIERLRATGRISEAEYQEIRRRLLDSIAPAK
jgi:hypothetical protein